MQGVQFKVESSGNSMTIRGVVTDQGVLELAASSIWGHSSGGVGTLWDASNLTIEKVTLKQFEIKKLKKLEAEAEGHHAEARA